MVYGEAQDQDRNRIVSGKDEGTKIWKGDRPGFEVMILLNFGAKFWFQIMREVNTREIFLAVFLYILQFFEILHEWLDTRERVIVYEILVIY